MFVECPMECTRQTLRHSAILLFPVVSSPINFSESWEHLAVVAVYNLIFCLFSKSETSTDKDRVLGVDGISSCVCFFHLIVAHGLSRLFRHFMFTSRGQNLIRKVVFVSLTLREPWTKSVVRKSVLVTVNANICEMKFRLMDASKQPIGCSVFSIFK